MAEAVDVEMKGARDGSVDAPIGHDNSVCGARCASALIATNGIKQCRKGCVSTESSPHNNPWHWCLGVHNYPPFHDEVPGIGALVSPQAASSSTDPAASWPGQVNTSTICQYILDT